MVQVVQHFVVSKVLSLVQAFLQMYLLEELEVFDHFSMQVAMELLALAYQIQELLLALIANQQEICVLQLQEQNSCFPQFIHCCARYLLSLLRMQSYLQLVTPSPRSLRILMTLLPQLTIFDHYLPQTPLPSLLFYLTPSFTFQSLQPLSLPFSLLSYASFLLPQLRPITSSSFPLRSNFLTDPF